MNEAARAKAFEDEMLKRLDPKGEMTETINVFGRSSTLDRAARSCGC
jgi:hypothetical protein